MTVPLMIGPLMPAKTLPLPFLGDSGRRTVASAGTMVGIDIGCHSLKIVQLEKGFRRIRPRVCRVTQHATPLNPADPLQCLDEIERTLRRAWSSRNRWWPLSAACTLSMNLMTFRTLELTTADVPTSTHQWQDLFYSESDTNPTKWTVDGWPSHVEQGARANSSYAALGVEQEFAIALAETLWKCGLDCKVLDGLPLAMARAAASVSTNGPVAVIDWGDTAMTLTIVISGRPYYTRVMRDCDLRSLTQVLTRSLQLDAQQCQQLLMAYGIGQSNGDNSHSEMSVMLAELTAPYLRRIDEELRRTWIFLQHLTGQTPTKVLLMGGGACLKMSDSVIRASLPIPTETWNLPHLSGKSHPDDFSNAIFGPAMALAFLARAK